MVFLQSLNFFYICKYILNKDTIFESFLGRIKKFEKYYNIIIPFYKSIHI